MSADFELEEQAPHKKKSRTASTSKSRKRSDHKHDYERIIIKSFIGYQWGRKCKVCGRIDDEFRHFSMSGYQDFMRPDASKHPGIGTAEFYSESEVREKFPGIPIYELVDMEYKEVNHD